MAIALERRGTRVYFGGDTFAAKDRIKQIGGHWDPEARQWWVGAKKAAVAEQLVAELATVAQRPTPGSAAVAAAVGLDADTPAGMVADRLEEAGRSREAAKVAAGGYAQRPADQVRLTGKGTYEGRSYFLGSQTRDGSRVLLYGLPRADGTYYERWVPVAEVTITKTYQPREYRGHTTYTTLGGIASFIARERRNRQEGGQVCVECGKSAECGAGGELVEDLEDGLLKHWWCCDIPPG